MNTNFKIDLGNGTYLAHRSHKYTKREWQGKGWRYWYGTEYKKDAENAKHLSSKESEYAKTMRGYIVNKKDDPWNPYIKKEVYNSNKKSAEYARTAYNSQKLYEKSLAYKVDQGKKLVDNLLSKLSKSANKAKKNIGKAVVETAKKLGAKPNRIETRTDISTGQQYRRVNGGPWEKVK